MKKKYYAEIEATNGDRMLVEVVKHNDSGEIFLSFTAKNDDGECDNEMLCLVFGGNSFRELVALLSRAERSMRKKLQEPEAPKVVFGGLP
jgi:hypothetical protein